MEADIDTILRRLSRGFVYHHVQDETSDEDDDDNDDGNDDSDDDDDDYQDLPDID